MVSWMDIPANLRADEGGEPFVLKEIVFHPDGKSGVGDHFAVVGSRDGELGRSFVCLVCGGSLR